MTKKSSAYILLFAAFLSVLLSVCSFSGKARMEVRWTEGSPKNIVEDFVKKHTSVSYPDECKGQNGQCAFLTLNNVRLYPCKRRISFSAVGEGKLEIVLAGGLNKKASVHNDYSYLKINGRNVTNDKKRLQKIGADKTYVKEISVKNGDTVTLDVKLRIHPEKAVYQKLFSSFVFSCIFLFIFFWGIKVTFFSKKDEEEYKKKIHDFINGNLAQDIANGYKSIDPVYRKAFWIVFLIINVVFGFHTVTFMWGNHDWAALLSHDSWDKWRPLGRYSANLVKTVFFNGYYLPVLSNLLSFAGLALTSVLLCVYWNVKKSVSIFVLCGLVLSIQPFTLEWLFYVTALPDLYVMPALMMTGFILADYSVELVPMRKKIVLNLMAVVFMNLGLAAYPSCLNILAVVFTGGVVVELLREKTIKQIIKIKFFALIDVGLACVLYKAILICLAYKNKIVSNHYTIEALPLTEMPRRFVLCIKASIEQLYAYDFPFMPNLIALIFTVLLGLVFISVLFGKKTPVRKLLISIAVFCSLLATKSATMISKQEVFFEPRIDMFGLVYFRVLTVVILFEAAQNIKNITFLLTSIALWISAVNDSYALRVWKLGFETEKMQWNRMLYRLETQKGFDSNKKYTFIEIGSFPSVREKFYDRKVKRTSLGLLKHPYDPGFAPFLGANTLYSGSLKIKDHLSSVYSADMPEYVNAIEILYQAGILKKAQEWPKENSLIVHKKIILLVADEKELKKVLKEWDDKEKTKVKNKEK